MTDYRKAFDAITADPRYLKNLDWGEARPGHPEGTVRAHIAEIEPNLEALRAKVTDEEYWKLKLLIHTHDSFKGESKQGVAITDPASHASIARTFLATHCEDDDLQAMTQYHDEPFALYRQVESKGKYIRIGSTRCSKRSRIGTYSWRSTSSMVAPPESRASHCVGCFARSPARWTRSSRKRTSSTAARRR